MPIHQNAGETESKNFHGLRFASQYFRNRKKKSFNRVDFCPYWELKFPKFRTIFFTELELFKLLPL